jgi:hypothetical protein
VSTPAYPALAAAMPDAAGATRHRATALLVTIEATSFVVGPALGGLLLATPTRPWVPVVAVLATLTATLLVAGVRLPLPEPVVASGPAATGPVAALRTSSATVRAVGVAGLLNFVDMALVIGLLPVAEHVWSGGGSGYGLATGLLGVGALAAPLLWRLGTTPTARARWGLLLLAVAVAVLPLTPAVAWALAPLAVAGAATVHVESAVTETIQDAVPDRVRAGVLGLTDSVMVAAALVGSLVAPGLVAALGVLGLFGLLTLVTLASLLAVGGRPRPAGQADAGVSSSSRSMVVRSGTSRMNRIATNAATASGAAIRNTRPVASPNAASKTVRTGAGRVDMSGIVLLLLPEPGFTPILARPELTSLATWWLSTAPSADTPMEPPIERKNATTELAAPMSRCAVLFCTASTRFCMVAPRPRPSTDMKAPTRSRLVVASIVLSSDRPRMTSTMPPTR